MQRMLLMIRGREMQLVNTNLLGTEYKLFGDIFTQQYNALS